MVLLMVKAQICTVTAVSIYRNTRYVVNTRFNLPSAELSVQIVIKKFTSEHLWCNLIPQSNNTAL